MVWCNWRAEQDWYGTIKSSDSVLAALPSAPSSIRFSSSRWMIGAAWQQMASLSWTATLFCRAIPR
jgi:hypothetical protein